MKRRSQAATIDELTKAFAPDPEPVVSLEERRRQKDERAAEKVAATQRARQADTEARRLTHRCCICGAAVTGRPGPLMHENAGRWVGYVNGVGTLTVAHCADCWRLVRKYQNEGYLAVEGGVLYDRLEVLGLLDYWPRQGSDRDINGCLVALSWAAWQFRHYLAGGEGEVGDPDRPFSHVIDNVPDPSTLDWWPEIE